MPLQTNSTSTKDSAGEIHGGQRRHAMPETDENGYSKVDGLEQGLYLLVEPVCRRTSPLPLPPFCFAAHDHVDGSAWNYDLTSIPRMRLATPPWKNRPGIQGGHRQERRKDR